MTITEKNDVSIGPQGTQVFDKDAMSELLADSIVGAQSDKATTPALIGVSQTVAGRKIILNKDKLSVGRSSKGDIVLDDAGVSSLHAQIIRHENDWKVLNLLSSNGTYVNGDKVSEKFLAIGDRLAFAGVEFVFICVDDPPPSADASQGMWGTAVAVLIVIMLSIALYFLL